MLTAIKGEIGSNAVVGDFNTPLTPMDRSSRQNNTVLTDTTDQIDLIDIYRTFHLKAAVYMFFSSTH